MPNDLTAAQRAAVAETMAAARIPGAAVAVVHRGRVAAAAFGYADLAHRIPATLDTLFPLASLTKSFTALAVLQLVQAGRLDLDDPVVRHIPWFRLADPAAGPRITVRMLLSHTSGLGRTLHLDPDLGAGYASRRDLVAALASAVPQTPPGTAWSYSNEGFATAGYLVDTCGDLPYPEHVTRRIFAPLGMDASTTDVGHWLRSPHRARGYAPGAGGEPEPVPDLPVAPASLPAGRICSTAPDLARYLAALLAGDGCPVLPGGLLRQLHTPASTWGDTGWGYGLGWFIQQGPRDRVVRHGGNLPGVATYLFLVPAEGLGVVVLTNLTGAPAKHLAEGLAGATLGRPVLRPGPGHHLPIGTRYAADPSRVAGCAGTYTAALADVTVAADGEWLQLRQRLRQTGAVAELAARPVADDLFFVTRGGADGMPLQFLRGAGGTVDRMLLAGTLYRRA